MRRTGFNEMIWIVVLVVVAAGVGYMVFGTSGSLIDSFDAFFSGETESNDRTRCRQKVDTYCATRSDSTNWASVKTDCREYIGDLFRGETCGQSGPPGSCSGEKVYCVDGAGSCPEAQGATATGTACRTDSTNDGICCDFSGTGITPDT